MVVGGSGGQRKVQRPKTSGHACFRGGGGERNAQPPKTSSCARFREVWVVVLSRGRLTPENEPLRSFSGGM